MSGPPGGKAAMPSRYQACGLDMANGCRIVGIDYHRWAALDLGNRLGKGSICNTAPYVQVEKQYKAMVCFGMVMEREKWFVNAPFNPNPVNPFQHLSNLEPHVPAMGQVFLEGSGWKTMFLGFLSTLPNPPR